MGPFIAGLLGLLCSVTVTCQQVDPSLTGQALLNMQTGPSRPPDFDELKVSCQLQSLRGSAIAEAPGRLSSRTVNVTVFPCIWFC